MNTFEYDTNPIIFIDLDDTVADFRKSAENILERKLSLNCRDITDEEWKKISEHKNFYRDLDLKDGAKDLVNFAYEIAYKNKLDVLFLSAIPNKLNRDWAISNKLKWIENHFSLIQSIFTFTSREKRFFSYFGNILIDDKEDVINEWNKGGYGILLRNCYGAKAELQNYLTFKKYSI